MKTNPSTPESQTLLPTSNDREDPSDWPIHETFFPPPGELSRLLAQGSVSIDLKLSKELASLWAEAQV